MCNSATGLLAGATRKRPDAQLVYLANTHKRKVAFTRTFGSMVKLIGGASSSMKSHSPLSLRGVCTTPVRCAIFDPYPMVLRAAGYLIRQGPVTPQERWEEASGYSPSTLASNIAALTCAACFARERGDEATAQFIQDYADFLECHIEAWTVTTEGTLVPGINHHFIRINPVEIGNPQPDEDPNRGVLAIRNRPSFLQTEFPARDIVDAGFLELVRYGIRPAGDPLIEDSLRVIDAVLKVETPFGPAWRRYNHDGYGQREDGSAYQGTGVGRAWPLLTGSADIMSWLPGAIRKFISRHWRRSPIQQGCWPNRYGTSLIVLMVE